MFDLAAATSATARDFDAIISRLDALADGDWHLPVRCTGWHVTDLAVHVIGASRGQAEGLRRAAAGINDLAQLDPPAERDPQALLAAVKEGKDQLIAALHELPESALGGAVPLPFGLLPAPVALQIVPLEYGFHRNDLEWALGNELPLSDDMSATLLQIAPGLLPILAAGSPVSAAGTTPADPVSYRLIAPSTRLLVSYVRGDWAISPDDPAGSAEATCAISGDDSAMALFVMGRVGSGWPGLTVSDAGTAAAFKRYFPGP